MINLDCLKYTCVLMLLVLNGIKAQSPAEGLENQRKIQIVNYSGDLGTIHFPGELTDIIFGLKRIAAINWKQFDSVGVEFVVRDLDEKIVSQGSVKSSNPGNGLLWVRLDPEIDDAKRGWFRVHLYVIGVSQNQRQLLGEDQIDLAILPPLAKRVDEPYVGVSMPNGGGAGAYLSAANILALQRLGIQQIRIFLKWNELQPDQKKLPDWRLIDRIVNQARDAGITVLPAVVGTPDWAVDLEAVKDRGQGKQGKLAQLKTIRPDAQKFATFLKQLVTRYKDRIHEWSI